MECDYGAMARSLVIEVPVILEQFDDPLLCADRICLQCGDDHDFRPKLDGIKTSIDIICSHIDAEKDARVIPKDELVIYQSG